MPSTTLLTRISLTELRLNNATSTDKVMSLCDDDKPPSVTIGARDDATGFETQPPSSSSPKVQSESESVALRAPKLPESAPSVGSRNPIDVEEEKLPDGHADKGSDSKSAKKRSDAFARYLSDANSFPDYGDRHRRAIMGPERLRHINRLAANPVNTLSVRRFEALTESDIPSAKRQKKDSMRTGDSTSPYFMTPRAKNSSEFPDVLAGSDDILELGSTSSAGNVGGNGLSLNEYRNALPQSRKAKRRRKTRTSSNSYQCDIADDGPIVYRPPAASTERPLISTISKSPDVLGFDQLPPRVAEIVSDISPPFNTKRDRPFRFPDNFGRQFKRHKPSAAKEPIDISEDELQGDSTKCSGLDSKKSQERAASRSSRTSGDLKKGYMRGDLHHTDFGKPPRQPRSGMIAITRAVCGKWTYDRDGLSGAVFLHRERKEGKKLLPVSKDGQVLSDHTWLGVDLDQVRHFGTSEETNRYGIVQRSQSGDAGPKLYLEFENHDAIEAFREILKSSQVEEKFFAELEKMAERAFDVAKNWIASNVATKNNSRIYTRDKKEIDLDPVSSSPDRRPGSTQAKLKDNLIQSVKDLSDPVTLQRVEEMPDRDTRRSTRSSAPSTSHRMPSPVGWTQLNPEWHESWKAPLVFPPTGKNRATVDEIDIPRLDETEFLNDNLINFYIRRLEYRLEKERPELLRKVYFFSTFFFEKLRSTRGKINYDGVKAWTAKVDLLSYDYIFVPVNENAHWYLAIICNVPNAVQSASEGRSSETWMTNPMPNTIEVTETPSSPRLSTIERDLTEISLEEETAPTGTQKVETTDVPPSSLRTRKPAGAAVSKLNPSQPRIITLDSLGGPHPSTCKALKEYLVEEAKTKKGIDLTTVPTGMTARGIPEQNNFCDCGLFVLGYMEEFIANPDEAAGKLLMKEDLGWDIRPSELRNGIREVLFDLQGEQQKRHKQLEEEKRLRIAKKRSLAETSKRNSSPVRPIEFSPPVPKLPGSFPSDSPESKLAPEAVLSSSESAQEADSSKSSGPKGRASHEAQQKSKIIEEFRFISPLPGSSVSPQTTEAKPFTVITSSTSKPDGRCDRVVVELKAAKRCDKSEFEESTLLDDDDDVQIVKELSSSPCPYAHHGSSKATETRKRRHSSVEIIGASTNRSITCSRLQKRENNPSINTSPRSKLRRSIEDGTHHDTHGGPKYDGIDRSGKLAGHSVL